MSGEQRWSKPGATDVPGADDMSTARDAATVPAEEGAPSAQQVDPGGYPHEPSGRVPGTQTGPRHGEERDAQPEPGARTGADTPRPDRGSADPDRV